MSNVKLVRLGKKGQIVIPKALRESMGVETGDLLLMTAEAGQLHIMPPEKYAKATRGLLKGTWGDDPDQVQEYLAEERDSWD
ncbi:AbrB/MazE/SpoVT family DNA-binding domain-containing protein [Candidatus Poribacteria bacterium]